MATRVNTLFTNDTPGGKLCQNFSMTLIILPIERERHKPEAGGTYVNIVDVLPFLDPFMHKV